METLTKRNKKYEEYIDGLKIFKQFIVTPLNNFQKSLKIYWF